MNAKFLAPMMIIVFAVVLLFPRPNDGAGPASMASDPSDVTFGAVQQPVGWADDGTTGTTLAREGDGHFYADITVAQSNYRMLVDTGASVVALTGADAEAMGLYWDESEVRVIGQGASGDVLGVAITIDKMQLGRHEARRVQAVIIPDGLAISLLGQSFLSGIGKVAIEGDKMVLGS